MMNSLLLKYFLNTTFRSQNIHTLTINLQKLALNNSYLHQSFNFEASNETKSLLKTFRNFVKNEIIPRSYDLDRTGEFPMDLLKKAHALGLMNLFVPVQYNGPGINYTDSLLMIEEIGYGCTGVGLVLTLNSLAGSAVLIHGNEKQKDYIKRLTSYPSVAAYCTTEPNVGSDVAGIKTYAKKDNDGTYIINGEKTWITNAAHADWYLVFAKTDLNPQTKTSKAFSAFLIEKGTQGITVGKKENNLGQRCSDTRTVALQDVKVDSSKIVGGLGNGFKVAMTAFDYQRPCLGALAVGLARRALDEALKYSLKKNDNGICPFDSQTIKFKLADMASGIETCRLAYLKAGWLYDKGIKNTYFASIAKCSAADLANKCAQDAVEICGNEGLSTNYPVEKLIRDAKVFQIYGGTCEIQRMIISREIVNNSKEELE